MAGHLIAVPPQKSLVIEDRGRQAANLAPGFSVGKQVQWIDVKTTNGVNGRCVAHIPHPAKNVRNPLSNTIGSTDCAVAR